MGDPGDFDAGTYGRGFADVYDDWYPEPSATASAVERLAALAGTGGTVLELGVGTGRLAVPLASRGCRVLGIDSSPEMLARLHAKDTDRSVTTLLGDVADDGAWPAERVDVVVAANNLLLNLADRAAQRRCMATAATHLRPGGHLVVETVLTSPPPVRERRLEVREVRRDRLVLIATDTDPGTGVVVGQHVELRDGEPVRLRPWRVRTATVAELDGWAGDAGLALVDRAADWAGAPFDPDGATQVSTYRA